jgi:two-component system nitrate/nitrite response regulator NarL
MSSRIHVAILDDHQSIIDGYTYRLSMDPDIQIAGTATYGEDLENMLLENEVDVLILDVSVPNSPTDHNQFPIIHVIPSLLEQYPRLNILIISMFTQHTLIDALVNIGISGYIFKDDQASIQQLDKIVKSICNGGIYFSPEAYQEPGEEATGPILTPRQLEALSLCDSTPDGDTIILARRLGITGSTLRNLLSGSYLRLGVRTRAAAIAKAHKLGILPREPEPVISGQSKSRPSLRNRQAKSKRLKQIPG